MLSRIIICSVTHIYLYRYRRRFCWVVLLCLFPFSLYWYTRNRRCHGAMPFCLLTFSSFEFKCQRRYHVAKYVLFTKNKCIYLNKSKSLSARDNCFLTYIVVILVYTLPSLLLSNTVLSSWLLWRDNRWLTYIYFI